MSKLARQISIVAALLLLFGAILTTVYLSQQKQAPKKKASTQQNLREVVVRQIKNESLLSQIDLQGRLVAFNKIDLFAEVGGVLLNSAKPFKVGTYFPKGAILLQLDQEEARLSLLSQKSNLLNAITQMMPDLKIDYPENYPAWKAYIDQFSIEGELKAFPEPKNEQEKFFVASRNIHSQYYTIKSASTRLNKYTIYAPFSGVITAANVNEGSLIRTGQQLGTLMNTTNYELEATSTLSDLQYLKVGSTVDLYSNDIAGSWKGKVKRISDQIDPTTQTVTIFIGVSGKNLREGMYLRGKVSTRQIANATRVSRDLIIDQNAIFIARDSQLQLQQIELVKVDNATAIVRGLPDGYYVPVKPVSGAYNGMKIKTKLEEGAQAVSMSAAKGNSVAQ